MGRLVVDELWCEGGELGDVAVECGATRVLLDELEVCWIGAGWALCLFRFVPKVNDLNRELIRSM
jgi:hypothetical protein